MGEKTEIVITVPRRKSPPLSGDELLRGIVRARREDDYLPRRLKKGGINFYDLLQIINPDNSISYNSFTGVYNTATGDAANGYTFPPYTTEQVENFVKIFTDFLDNYALADWKKTFLKIKKSDAVMSEQVGGIYFKRTETDIYDDLLNIAPEFTDDALKLTQSQVNSFRLYANAGLLFNPNVIDFADLSGYKITATKDFAAAAVAFTPTPEMNLFLMPSIGIAQVDAQYKDGLHSYTFGGETFTDVVTKWFYLGYGIGFIERRMSEIAAVQSYIDEGNPYNYKTKMNSVKIARLINSSEVVFRKHDFQETPTHPYYYSGGSEGDYASDYPPLPLFSPEAPVTSDYSYIEGFTGDFYTNRYISKLTLIIQQGENWFYFWKL